MLHQRCEMSIFNRLRAVFYCHYNARGESWLSFLLRFVRPVSSFRSSIVITGHHEAINSASDWKKTVPWLALRWQAGRSQGILTMGYKRIITYTQRYESGASLRAAGFMQVKTLPARGGWAASSVKMKEQRDPVGNGGVERVLWEVTR